MPQRRVLRTWLFLVCTVIAAVALVVPFWVSAAPGSSGTVQQVTVGTYVTFSGNGFQANEQLSLWADAPDTTRIPLDGTQADANGGFSISVSFPSAGMWQVTAHGNTSGIEYVGQFSVSTTAPASPPPLPSATTTTPTAGTSTTTTPTAGTSTTTTGSPVPSTTTGSPPAGLPPGTSTVNVGATATFSGSGFTAGETINIWVTAPDATVTPLDTISADGSGGANGSTTFSSGGLWQVTMHGKDSAHEVVARFYVPGGTAPPASTTTSGTTTSSGSVPAGLPPGTQTTTIGASVSFSGSGFNANEGLGVWVTGPDATVTPLDAGFADGAGSFSGSTAFGTAGLWQVTMHGKDSAHEVVARFYVTGDATSGTSTGTSSAVVGPSSNGSVVKVQASQRVTFTVTGFAANENVAAWTTSPEGTVSGLDGTQANNLGRVTITTTFPSAGLWQVTAHGQTSGHEAVGQYQVSTPA